jgi:hypothetical protein
LESGQNANGSFYGKSQEFDVILEYDVFVEDMVALGAYHAEHTPSERRRRYLAQGVILITFVVLTISSLSSVISGRIEVDWTPATAVISFLPLLCPTVLLLLVFTPFVRRWGIRRAVHRTFGQADNGVPVGRHRLSLDQSGIALATQAAEMHVLWADIARVDATETHVFVMDDNGQALVVPRHAFADQDAFQAFVAAVKDRPLS